jgi:hypothetical protein
MAVRVMGMTASKFFGAGFPDTHHRYIKPEILPRQGMIAVNGYHIARNPGYGYDLVSIGSLGPKLHALFHPLNPFKPVQGQLGDEFFVPTAIGLRRGNGYFKGIPLRLAFQGPFQSGNNIFMSVEIKQRVGPGGRIDQLILRIGKGIPNTDYQIFSDIHDLSYHIMENLHSGRK